MIEICKSPGTQLLKIERVENQKIWQKYKLHGKHGHMVLPCGHISCMLASQRNGCKSCAQEAMAKAARAKRELEVIHTMIGLLLQTSGPTFCS